MAGIRSYNNNLPYVFRFPEWIAGIFYPAGSVVSTEVVASEGANFDFYAARKDVIDRVTPPHLNPLEWRRVHDVDQIDSDVLVAIENFETHLSSIFAHIDSDAERITHLEFVLDSEIDFNIDSEIHGRMAADSDIRALFHGKIDSEMHDRMAADSDLNIVISNKLDSEYHDRRSADSDLSKFIDSEELARKAADSDIQVLFHIKIDSESAFRKHEIARLDSDIQAFKFKDSEYDSDITALERRLDSDYKAGVRIYEDLMIDSEWGPQPFISNTRYYIDNEILTNHTRGILWLLDHETGITYIIKNGKKIAEFPADPTTELAYQNNMRFTRGARILDSGGGADVAIYQEVLSSLPIRTNAWLYDVHIDYRSKAVPVTGTSLEDAYAQTVLTLIQIDSDLHDILEEDSGLQKQITDNDSDIHALYAYDSDFSNGFSAIRTIETSTRTYGSLWFNAHYYADSDRWVALPTGSGWIFDRIRKEVILFSFGFLLGVFQSRDSEVDEVTDGVNIFRKITYSPNNGRKGGTGIAQIVHDSDIVDSTQIYTFQKETPDYDGAVPKAKYVTDSDLTIQEFARETTNTIRHLANITTKNDSDGRKTTDWLQVQITDNDSDILWLYNRDSDFTSDIDSELHALRNKDSEIIHGHAAIVVPETAPRVYGSWRFDSTYNDSDDRYIAEPTGSGWVYDHVNRTIILYNFGFILGVFENRDGTEQSVTDGIKIYQKKQYAPDNGYNGGTGVVQLIHDGVNVGSTNVYTYQIETPIYQGNQPNVKYVTDSELTIWEYTRETTNTLRKAINIFNTNDSELRKVNDAQDIRLTDNESDIQWLYDRDSDFTKDFDSEIHYSRAKDSDIINGYSAIKTIVGTQFVYGSWKFDSTYNDSDKFIAEPTGSGWVYDKFQRCVVLYNFGFVIGVFENRDSDVEEVTDGVTVYKKIIYSPDNGYNGGTGNVRIFYQGYQLGTTNCYSFEIQTPATGVTVPGLTYVTDSDLTIWEFARTTTNTIKHLANIVKKNDSDAFERIRNIDSDILQAIHNYMANDSEMDSDIRQAVHDFLYHDSDLWHNVWEADSEIRVRVTDNESDIQWLYDRDSDFTTNVDSDILSLRSMDSDQWIVIRDNDSEINRRLDSERHDRKSVDSDLQVQIVDNDSDIMWLYDRDSDFTKDFDSEVHDLKAEDSDQWVAIRDNDSDISWLRNRIVEMEDEEDSDNAITRGDHDSDLKQTYHDFKNGDSDLQTQITDNDSDIQWLYDRDSDFTTAVDSDILALRSEDSDQWIVIADNDSEINRRLDSERHDRKATDSDFDVRITDNDSDIMWLYDRDSDFTKDFDSEILALKSTDSDQWVAIRDNDSDIAWLRDRIVEMEDEEDSDNAITRGDHDSDLKQTYHDFKNGDSDLQTQITDNDSDIQWLYDRDSDFTTAIDSDILSLRSTDSDQWVAIIDNDSDISWLRNRIIEMESEEDSDNAVTRGDHDSDLKQTYHDFKNGDSDLQTQITDNDSDILWLYNRDSDFTTSVDSDILALRSEDSDQWIVIRDNDSEINRRLDSEKHDRKSVDSDLQVQITDNDSDIQWLYDRDSDFTKDFDSEILALKSTDSDQWVAIIDNDSDIAWLRNRIVEMESEEDSDNAVTRGDHDSDLKQTYHDFKNGDSDLQTQITDNDSDILWLYNRDSDFTTAIDSDILALKSTDSDQWVAIIDNDSDITWLRNRIIEMESEEDSDNAVTRGDHDSDLKQTYHDFKNGDSDLQIQITDNDSDIQWLYDRDSDFTTAIDSDILSLRSEDSDQWIVIRDNDSEINRRLDSEKHERKAGDSDLWHKLREVDSDLAILFGRTDSDDVTLQSLHTEMHQRFDSERHDWKAADSDLTKNIDSDIHALYSQDSDHDSDYRMEIHDRKAGDSDLNVRVDSETHDRKSADSDLQVQITDNDSDILWLYNRDSDFTTSIDSDIHDLKAADSDLRVMLKDNDSDIRQAVHDYLSNDSEFDSDMRQIIHDFLYNDSDLWHEVWEADSELRVRITDNESDIQWLYDRDSDFTTAIDSDILALQSTDSDQWIVIRDNDSEINRRLDSERHDRKSVDSDLWHKLREVDSDLAILFGRTDSDDVTLQSLHTEMHERLDSERHDWKAADSDISKDIDSDIHALKSYDSDNDSDITFLYDADSDLFARLDSEYRARKDADSDIWNGHHATGYDWTQTEVFSATTDASADIRVDSDTTGQDNIYTYVNDPKGWIWFPTGVGTTGYLMIIKTNNVIYEALHPSEPASVDLGNLRYAPTPTVGLQVRRIFKNANVGTRVSYEFTATTINIGGPLVRIDSDLTLERFVHTTGDTLAFLIEYTVAADSELQKQIADNDSDIHTLFAKDSDFTFGIDSDLHSLRATDSDQWIVIADNDSEINRRLDSERHDRKAEDSDIRELISDLYVPYARNDSDIEVRGIFFNNDSEGYLSYNPTRQTLSITANSETEFKQNIGQDLFMFGKFSEAVSKGDVIMFAGAQGDHLLFRKADLSVPGFRDEWIVGAAANSYGINEFGHVTTQGIIENIDTSSFSEGSILYVDNDPANAGRMLDSEPTTPNHAILIAAVTRSHLNSGSIMVRPVFGKSHLSDLHDVSITEPAEGKKHNQVLSWDSDLDIWKNTTLNGDFGEF